MAEYSELKTGAERRTYPRVLLDAPFFVTLRRNDGLEIPALIVDLGCGGAQVALSPGTPGRFHAWLGRHVVVLGVSELVAYEGESCEGMISWVSAERCGVRFKPPLSISNQELLSIIESL